MIVFPIAAGAVLGVALLFASTPQSTADEVSERARRIESRLAAPASPATTVLLLEAAGDPRVDEYWRRAMTHDQPAVRGATARAVRIAGRVGLIDTIVSALDREQDGLAASEMAQAVVELTGQAHRSALAAAQRLPYPVAGHVLQSLTRVQPEAVPAHIATLANGFGTDEAAADVLAYLLKHQPAVAIAATRVLVQRDSVSAWNVILPAYARTKAALPEADLETGLASRTRGVAEAIRTHRERQAMPGGTLNGDDAETSLALVHDLPEGVFVALRKESGCPSMRAVAVSAVVYGARGLPVNIVVPTGLPERCREAIFTMLRLGSAYGAQVQHFIGVPLEQRLPPRFGDRFPAQPIRLQTPAPSGVTPPRLTREVKPQFPRDALARNASGDVILEAVISAEGLPSRVRVVKSPDRTLEAESIATLLEWRFAAGRLDGQPAPMTVVVQMTFTIPR